MRQLLVVAIAGLMLAGCSDNPSVEEPYSPTLPETAPTASNPTSAAESSSVSNCLNGRYQLVRFVGTGAKGAFGTGEGGDVAVTFDDGAYVLRGAGEDPINLTRAGLPVDLLVDGSISGDYRLEGTRAIFTSGEGTGSATLSIGPLDQSVSMEQIGNTLTQDGEAELACANDALIVTVQDVRLELARV